MAALEDSIELARKNYAAFVEAKDFETAKRAWHDFIGHWSRGLNACDKVGKIRHGKSWTKVDHLRKDNPAALYLHAARNEFEHGIAPINEQGPGGMTAVAGSGVKITSVQRSRGRLTVEVTTVGGPVGDLLAVGFTPEPLQLLPVHTREGIVSVPAGYEDPLLAGPAKLGEECLSFLETVAAKATA